MGSEHMAMVPQLFLPLFLILSKANAVKIYEATASSRSHLDDEIGCYSKTDLTSRAQHLSNYIYKKKSPKRYLLQLKNGNWAITEDTAGERVVLEQERSNYPRTPDTQMGFWTLRGKTGRSVHTFKIIANEKCKEEELADNQGWQC